MRSRVFLLAMVAAFYFVYSPPMNAADWERRLRNPPETSKQMDRPAASVLSHSKPEKSKPRDGFVPPASGTPHQVVSPCEIDPESCTHHGEDNGLQ